MCNHHSVRKYKVIKIKGDKYHQTTDHCLDCKLQTLVRLEEIRKDSWSVRA